METDRKELDESKQMPAGTQSTDPGGDAEAQVNCRLRNDRAKQQDVKTNGQQWYRAVPDVYNKTQRINESLANAAIVFITQVSLHAFRLVIEHLSQFYKTSAKVTAETIQYTADSTYKTVQEEWTRIEGMIQSKLERIIQETHAAGEGSARSVHPR